MAKLYIGNSENLAQAIDLAADKLPLSGGTMTGAITLAADPTAAMVSFGEGAKIEVPAPSEGSDAANKDYVDSAVSTAGDGKFLPLAGGTMTGAAVMAAGAMETAQARNIYFTSTDLEAGVTSLPKGSIAIVID